MVPTDASLEPVREPRTRGNWVATIIATLEERGLAGEVMASEAGIPAGLAGDPDRYVPTTRVTRLWAAASEATRDPSFGLQVAERIPPAGFGAIGIAVLSSETIGQALHRIARFSSSVGDAVIMALEDDGDRVRVSWSPVAAFPLAHEATEVAALLTLRALRALVVSPARLDPVLVTLRRPAPEDASPFEQRFGAPVTFGASRDAIEFLGRDLLQRTAAGDSLRAQRAEQIANDQRPSWGLRVRDTLVSLLVDGTVSERELAGRLGISRSLLQLRLSGEGTSYRKVLREVRESLATAYLAEGRLPVAAIGKLLGFAHTSGFSRAFKQWTGMSPRAYAESAGAPGSER